MVDPFTLEFLARQHEHILSELAGVRAELAGVRTELAEVRGTLSEVLTAMAIRHENTIKAVLAELQAMHQFNARPTDRLQKLEDAGE